MTAETTSMLLDLRGLQCPLPALRTRKALRKLAPGDLLVVECTDPLAAIDIPHLVNQMNDALERQEAANGLLTFHIRRSLPDQAQATMSKQS
ncbi:sulfurtransferase TusA family protein [Methylocapsa aurea]|uniref:sulfurtransferase TusA family protein n=1 Tax=Methylocapsa aurea TaxID=663610 RepID=UPI000562DADB|nr:sulfurtransferase TusA family protein [Methylocapsa aurea]